MIRTNEDLGRISETITSDSTELESLTYIPPSAVADIESTRQLTYELYQDEDTRRWNLNALASVVLGANGVLASIFFGSFHNILPVWTVLTVSILFSISAIFAVLGLWLRNSKRPMILGDTAKKLGLNKDQYLGVISYNYAYDFLYNRSVTNDKKIWVKRSMVMLAISVGSIFIALFASALGFI